MPRISPTLALPALSLLLACALAETPPSSDPGCDRSNPPPTYPTKQTPTNKTPSPSTPPASCCGSQPPSWSASFFEPSIIQSRLPITPEDVAFEANATGLGLPCGATLPGSKHVVGCSGTIGGGWTLDPPLPPLATVVYLPGWSSDLERSENRPTGSVIPFFSTIIADTAPAFDRVRFVAPIPPFRKVTASPNEGPPTSPRSWFDFLKVPTAPTVEAVASLPQDRLGIYRAVERVSAVVESERCKHSIPANRVFLYGHSFGAAAAYAVALQTDIPFAGLFTSAGFLPGAGDIIARGLKAVNTGGKGYGITVTHGVNDTTIPPAFGALSANLTGTLLAPLGANVTFTAFPGVTHTSVFRSEAYARSLVSAILAAFR